MSEYITNDFTDLDVSENHIRYAERMALYCSFGYDILKSRTQLAERLSHLSPDARILDVGCGKGNVSIAIARSGHDCIAIDSSAEELMYAQLNAAYFDVKDKIKFKIEDARVLSFEPDYFDAVVCADLMHHLEEIIAVVAEMVRVCKKGGVVIIADLNKKGRRIMDTIHQNEGRVHHAYDLSMDRVKQWFVTQEYEFLTEEVGCQTVVVIKKE
jgi:ubiquinone/menaquinone biosynthesis C-methylase UbiE